MEGGNPGILRDMVNANLMGRKSGKGFFDFQSGSKRRPPTQEAAEIVAKYNMQPKIPLTDADIMDRLLLRFVNEAVMCLQEDILRNPIEGDIGAVFGLGFPPFLGGMYCRRVGSPIIYDLIPSFAVNYSMGFFRSIQNFHIVKNLKFVKIKMSGSLEPKKYKEKTQSIENW